ncbi:hypothetical protein GTP81_31370, partial [Rugamonas sp. FT107W]
AKLVELRLALLVGKQALFDHWNQVSIRLPTSCQSWGGFSRYPSEAAARALVQYQITGEIEQRIVVKGIEFNVNIGSKPGQPAAVKTAYPVGKAK